MSNSGKSTGSRVTDQANREIMETQRIHIFTSLSTPTALQVLSRAPGDDPLHSSLPAIPLTSSYRDPGQGRVDDGQWQVELIGERGYRLSAHLEAEEEMFPDGGIC